MRIAVGVLLAGLVGCDRGNVVVLRAAAGAPFSAVQPELDRLLLERADVDIDLSDGDDRVRLPIMIDTNGLRVQESGSRTMLFRWGEEHRKEAVGARVRAGEGLDVAVADLAWKGLMWEGSLLEDPVYIGRDEPPPPVDRPLERWSPERLSSWLAARPDAFVMLVVKPTDRMADVVRALRLLHAVAPRRFAPMLHRS
jgi:hypothetical protein